MYTVMVKDNEGRVDCLALNVQKSEAEQIYMKYKKDTLNKLGSKNISTYKWKENKKGLGIAYCVDIKDESNTICTIKIFKTIKREVVYDEKMVC